MSSDFTRIVGYLKEMNSAYFRALSAFYVYEGLVEATAPNIVGDDKAHENLEVMNTFKDFFLISKEALRVYFFLELAKLFDTSNQSLQINKVVNFTESQIKNLKVEDFSEHNKDRSLVEELIKDYKGITHEDILALRQELEENKEVVKRLILYRDKWLAHNDIKKPDVPLITGEEIVSLFKVLESIMNTLSSRMNHETTSWRTIEENSKHHTSLVLEYLHRFEPYRVREIYAESEAEEARLRNDISGKASKHE